jgi:hypothetical protein
VIELRVVQLAVSGGEMEELRAVDVDEAEELREVKLGEAEPLRSSAMLKMEVEERFL